jgi:osmoprotectant transport system substrate-binding protein
MMRRPTRVLLALLVPLALFAGACSSDSDDTAADSSLPEVKIGIQDFPESQILAQVYGQALEAEGFTVSYKELGGFRDIVYSSFESGDINFTLDYASSALEFLNEQAGEASADIDAVAPLLQTALEADGLTALDPSPAVDSNAYVVTKETAESKGLTSMADLTPDLRLGGFADCPTNPFCIPGIQEVYGVDLSSNFVSQDGGELTKTALEGGEIDVAVLTTTDPSIAENDWVILSDDEGLINADNIIQVLTQDLLDAGGATLSDLVNDISAKLDTEGLTELNRLFVIDKEDADDVASDWLEANGFKD